MLLLGWNALTCAALIAAGALARIEKRGELRWAGDLQGGEPYVHRNPADPSKLDGFEVEIAEGLAKRLGVRQRFVQNDWSTLIPSLVRGDFDAAMNGIEDTPALRAQALVTRPLEGLLAGTENVKTVRSTSSQGLSAIQVVFDRGGDPYRQRQVVTERLAESAGVLPQGVAAPLLSPLSSSMEYLVHFGYTSERLSPVELRDVVQWIVKPQILAVPGVAQAQIFGGEVRERQIEIDPAKLAAAGLVLDDVLSAARATHLR